MALLVPEGFDHYGLTIALLQSRSGVSFPSTTLYSLIAGRNPGSNALRMFYGALTSLRYSYVNAGTVVVGFYFRSNFASYAIPGTLFRLQDVLTTQVSMAIQPDGRLLFYRGDLATLLFTSSNVLQNDTWNHLECRATIDPAVGSFEVRINGSSVGWIPLQSGQNTRVSANSSVNGLGFFSTSGVAGAARMDYDDLYILDTTGPQLNNFQGDSKIVSVFPAANGSLVQWTPNGAPANFQCVNVNPPDDAKFVSDSTPGNRDLYDFSAIDPAFVLGAALLQRASKSDAGARSISPVVKSGATTVVGAAQALSATFTWYQTVFELDPNTGLAWAFGDLNAAEFGQDTV